MSDFLSRLVGRSLGPSQAMQPRVPSLYEPHRKGTGPLWAKHAFGAEDAGRESKNELTFGDEPGSENRGPQSEFRPEEPSRRPKQAQSVTLVNLGHGTEESQLVRPSGSAVPAVRSVAQAREAASVSPEDVSNKATQAPSQAETAIPSNAIRPSGLFRAAIRNGAASNSEGAERPSVELRGPQLSGQSLIAGTAKADAAIPSDPPVPSRVPAAKPPMLVVPSSSRSQKLDDPEAANFPASSYISQTSEPSIRVSIGRVEVRAIFPTPPPRRAPPARPKPSLSLDDYLKQRNRGRQ
jgi:hypothetical protein